ncbi:hypothetical protein LZ838_26240 [Pseudomonas sp. AA27]|uniref:hypothetical protein n=1 Tax=Pseudomonas sp. AA27 TaxID=2908652 RepID=UPI001F46358C|nr:hypothetical protein [Pseudomonas sp. AA27]MCF1490862.1 hypothetical protein [Pseudomonas sp. AA27]
MNTTDLTQFVMDHHTSDQYCHVLIDPTAVSRRSDHAVLEGLRQGLGAKALTPIYRADLAHAPDAHPVLACLASPGEPLPESLVTLTARASLRDVQRPGRLVCGWLFSDTPAAALAEHIMSLCEVSTTGMQTCFYPVFEPVRLELLAAAYEHAEQMPWWPIHRWLFLTSGGFAVRMIGEPYAQKPIPVAAGEMQAEAPLVQAMLSAWRALLPQTDDRPSLPAVAAVLAYEEIVQARRQGLSEPADIIALALHQRCLHPQLHTYPALRTLIDKAVHAQIPLTQTLAEYTESNWRYVLANLPQSGVRP